MSIAVQQGLITALAIRFQVENRAAFRKEAHRVLAGLVPRHRPLPEARQSLCRILRLALARVQDADPVELLARYDEARSVLQHVNTHRELLDTTANLLMTIFAADCSVEPGRSEHPFGSGMSGDTVFQSRLKHILQGMSDNELAGLTAEGLGKRMGYSRSHLCVRARQVTGHTPREMILGEKLRRAMILLADGQTTIHDIAITLGFSSAKRFRNAFRAATGMCPSEWGHRTK